MQTVELGSCYSSSILRGFSSSIKFFDFPAQNQFWEAFTEEFDELIFLALSLQHLK
jgi:hypothetical protein